MNENASLIPMSADDVYMDTAHFNIFITETRFRNVGFATET